MDQAPEGTCRTQFTNNALPSVTESLNYVGVEKQKEEDEALIYITVPSRYKALQWNGEFLVIRSCSLTGADFFSTLCKDLSKIV